MEATRLTKRTLVVTTTPSATHGLDELNAALRGGWRVVHMAVLEHAAPGTNEAWPEGHFTALLLLEPWAVGRRDAWEADAAESPAASLPGRERSDLNYAA